MLTQEFYNFSFCLRRRSRRSSARLLTSWLRLLVRLIWTDSLWTGSEFNSVKHICRERCFLIRRKDLIMSPLCFRYKAIVKYKTAFYSFYLPVAAAMYIVSIRNLRNNRDQIESLQLIKDYWTVEEVRVKRPAQLGHGKYTRNITLFCITLFIFAGRNHEWGRT